MLSFVLNSAIGVNIRIIRVFTKMREMLIAHKDILLKLEEIEYKYLDHDQKIMLIFEFLKQLEKKKQQELEHKHRRKIGFKTEKD
jgi:hypothetical protein